jgi:hypothetical protein
MQRLHIYDSIVTDERDTGSFDMDIDIISIKDVTAIRDTMNVMDITDITAINANMGITDTTVFKDIMDITDIIVIKDSFWFQNTCSTVNDPPILSRIPQHYKIHIHNTSFNWVCCRTSIILRYKCWTIF